MFRYKDRVQAGKYLAKKLEQYAKNPDAVVLGLPRGGVVVAYEVARELQLPLDIFLVRKLGVPGYEELAMGAIASGGVRVMNEDVLRMINISQDKIEAAVKKEEKELERREKAYRGDRPGIDLKSKILILIDDGLATGATMRAAVSALYKQQPRKIVMAVPVASPETCESFKSKVDDLVCAMTPAYFHAVGEWYEYFPQNTDEEVQQLLHRAADL
ncbi:MAG: phosphoribosyltransferase [Smithella sp.]